MTGFTVTDEMADAAAKAIYKAHPAPSNVLARAALEAAARTAQPAPPEPTDEEQQFIDMALLAADSGSAGHWPTVAGHLADEVRRMRAIIALVPQPASPTADDYVRATAEAVVIDPDEAVAYRHRTVAANAAWRTQREFPQEASAQPTPVVDEKRLAEAVYAVLADTAQCPTRYLAEKIARRLAAGVFKTEAEVRATAIEDVAEAYLYDGDRDSQLPGYVALIECAAAIRAGGQA